MPVNLAYKAYQFLWEALDWIYPPSCGGCSASGARWCEDCARGINEVKPPFCPICGNPNPTDEPCQRCRESQPSYTALRSCAVFEGSIQEGIHRYKYKHDVGLGESFAKMMIPKIEKLNWTLNLVTSVPLGLVRLRERGYNQATLLARPIALYFGIPFSSRALSRTRETRTQVGLTVSERKENMADAFQARSEVVLGKVVLVVDDVATSGATLNACSKALLEAGAQRVYGFSLARAVFSDDGKLDHA